MNLACGPLYVKLALGSGDHQCQHWIGALRERNQSYRVTRSIVVDPWNQALAWTKSQNKDVCHIRRWLIQWWCSWSIEQRPGRSFKSLPLSPIPGSVMWKRILDGLPPTSGLSSFHFHPSHRLDQSESCISEPLVIIGQAEHVCLFHVKSKSKQKSPTMFQACGPGLSMLSWRQTRRKEARRVLMDTQGGGLL